MYKRYIYKTPHITKAHLQKLSGQFLAFIIPRQQMPGLSISGNRAFWTACLFYYMFERKPFSVKVFITSFTLKKKAKFLINWRAIFLC